MGIPLEANETVNEQSVFSLGLPKSLDLKTASANLLPVNAPLQGVVISRDVVTGETVDPGKTLFVVADVRHMWLNADIHQAEARKISLGQEVAFFAEDSANETAGIGKVSWMSTAVDSQTRTVKIRAELDNRDGKLLAKSFGTARITLREIPKAVAVPNGAIQHEERGPLVFVRSGESSFEIRTIRPGIQDGNYTEVIEGLKSGEVVVTTGSYALKSELLKSKLGPGCVDD
jgi:cobalt-zinc-cadmium efflux system membrane fusion protein